MSLIFRSFALTRGFAGRLLSYFERRNPDALLENEREKLRKLIMQFNGGLVAHAAVWERLISKVAKSESETTQLAAQIKAYVKMGDRTTAAKYALELQQVNGQLEADRLQLASSEQTYNQLVRRRDEAIVETKNRIEQVRRQIGDLKVKRAVADLEGMASSMIGSLGGSGDGLARLQELVEEERETAAARVRVASGAFSPALDQARETLREVLAEEALEAFLESQVEEAAIKALPDYSIEQELPISTTNRKEKIQ